MSDVVPPWGRGGPRYGERRPFWKKTPAATADAGTTGEEPVEEPVPTVVPNDKPVTFITLFVALLAFAFILAVRRHHTLPPVKPSA